MAGDRRPRPSTPLSRGQIKSIFQNLEYLDTAEPDATARALAGLDPDQRAFVEHWQGIIARSDGEVAKLFVRRAPRALALMDRDGVEDWLLRALEQFDQRGLGWAVEVLNGVDTFAAERAERARSLTLAEVAPLLGRLVTGLGGRELRIEPGEPACTDTETLYLPPRLRAADREAAFRHYKALAVHHWAQTVYGTWHPRILEALAAHPEPAALLTRYAALERARLDACIARELPGVGRDLAALASPPPPPWDAAGCDSAQASLARAAELLPLEPPPPAPYHGAFDPRRVQARLQARLARERRALRLRLGRLQQEAGPEPEDTMPRPPADDRPRRRKPSEGVTLTRHPGEAGRAAYLIEFDDRKVGAPDDLRQLLDSIHQDLGEIPDHYLRGLGRRGYDPDRAGAPPGDGEIAAADAGTPLRYPEWDYTRQRFRPDYCLLRETEVAPGDPEFVADTRRKYHGLIKSIRRSFEALLGGVRLERRQPEGDDIDLDALVEARVDVCHGDEPGCGVHTRLRDTRRSIAVLFMVDMSGSTRGWVNDAEREALVLLCEALETIGDRYAIYGFSGRTHQRVELYRIKRFGERYGRIVQTRIAGIRPRAYTRMGAPIRHLGGLLRDEPARHKLLVTLSDGKPEDYGSYTGRYGIEDTRHALLEQRRAGVHPFCITIDREGGDYLPYMYGPANYAVIDSVPRLPLKVADIYRRLTS